MKSMWTKGRWPTRHFGDGKTKTYLEEMREREERRKQRKERQAERQKEDAERKPEEEMRSLRTENENAHKTCLPLAPPPLFFEVMI